MNQNPKLNSEGFTLIETMMTVVVLGILIAIAAPYFGDLIKSRRLISATEASIKLLNSTKAQAEKEARDFYVSTVSSGTSNWSLTLSTCDVTDSNYPCTPINFSPIKSENYPGIVLIGPNVMKFVYRTGEISYNNLNEKEFTLIASAAIKSKVITTSSGLITACTYTDLITVYSACTP